MKRIAVIAVIIFALSGCSLIGNNESDDTYQPAYFDEASSSGQDGAIPETSQPPITVSSIIQRPQTLPQAVSSEITLTPRRTSGGLSLTVDGVYADGKFYTVEIVGSECENQSSAGGTTAVNGVLYGDFKLKSSINGEPTGLLTLKSNDKFLIMGSIAEEITYGCEVISNFRQFGAKEYPDIIELDFYIENELEVPQYARFFAVRNGEIIEIPVYENGSPAKPLGAHLELRSAGRMVQHLTVSSGIPDEYEIVKYEYIYDLENRRLNRKRVKFYGWEID